MMTVAGLILAGGRSSRMGGPDKALLKLGGQPLVQRVLDRLASQASPVAINTNADPKSFAGYGIEIIADTIAGYQGPLAGVLAGLAWASPHASRMLSVAADTPFFPTDLCQRLAQSAKPGRVAVASAGGRLHPTFALWPSSLREPLAHFLQSSDSRRVMTFLQQAGMDVVEFSPTSLGQQSVDPFFNINTPDDLATAETMLGGAK